MDIYQFYKEIKKLAPSNYEGAENFRDHLSKQLRSLDLILNQLDRELRPEQWDKLMSEVSYLSRTIKEVVKRYYKGQHSFAYGLLKKAVSKHLIPCATIESNKVWYRMRVFENKNAITPKELFHIPFDKRGSVATQRYSATGYPCLYLGASIFSCWEELNRPELNRSFVSKLENNRELKVLNLNIPSFADIQLSLTDGSFVSFIKRLPIIISTMVQVKNDSDTFKPEYIVPQLLMEFVIDGYRNKKQDNPIGIVYSSVNQNHDFNFDGPDANEILLQNIAIPVQNPFNGNYCQILCNIFSISEPSCDEFEQAKQPYEIKSSTNGYQYSSSVFGLLEQRLSDCNKFPMQIIDFK